MAHNNNPLLNVRAVLLDIDGTLIDSNDAHTKAWVDVLAENDIKVTYEEVREKIGMGGDHLLPLVTGISEDSEKGKAISNRRGEIFRQKYLPTLKPFRGTRDLLKALQQKGIELVVATSASEKDLDKLLEQAGIRDLLQKKTSSSDAESSKPDPDIIEAALKKISVDKSQVRMIGDTPYDIQAAGRAGVKTIAFTSGGWAPKDLGEAVAILSGPQELLETLRGQP